MTLDIPQEHFNVEPGITNLKDDILVIIGYGERRTGGETVNHSSESTLRGLICVKSIFR